jgi:hypothetical protein
MLGYSDPFSSLGQPSGAAYYSNLEVVEIGAPFITGISRVGSGVTITFTSSDGNDVASTFALQGAALVNGPYANVPGATVTQLPNGTFQATATSTAETQFFRIAK